MNIAVFASGRGTNFSAIAGAVKKGKIKANLSLVVCDKSEAGVIQRAQKAGVKVVIVKREDFVSKANFEEVIIGVLKREKIGLIVLAGFMRVLSAEFTRKYKNRILNIHPSLLPSFKGAHAIKDAYDYKAKVTGVTVHFVDEQVDHGPIVLQEAVDIKPTDTLASLEERIHKIEHKLYPEAVRLFVEGKL